MPDDLPPTWSETAVRAALASVPYVGGALEIVYSDVRARRAARADALMAELIAATGEKQLADRLRDSPYVESVFVSAIDAALRTSIDAKRHLLVLAVSAAVLDDAKVDESLLLANVLNELDVPHVLALARMADEWHELLAQVPAEPSFGISKVWEETPEPIRAALVRTGTAVPPRTTFHASSEPTRQAGISDFGLELTAALRANGLPE